MLLAFHSTKNKCLGGFSSENNLKNVTNIWKHTALICDLIQSFINCKNNKNDTKKSWKKSIRIGMKLKEFKFTISPPTHLIFGTDNTCYYTKTECVGVVYSLILLFYKF